MESKMAYAKETTCVQGSGEAKDVYGSISYPIYLSATYAHPALGETTGYAYGRAGNPTRDELQRTVAALETENMRWLMPPAWRQLPQSLIYFLPGTI